MKKYRVTRGIGSGKPIHPPRSARYIPPDEQAWLDEITRQLAYDEYMQAQRESWLFERPSRKKNR